MEHPAFLAPAPCARAPVAPIGPAFQVSPASPSAVGHRAVSSRTLTPRASAALRAGSSPLPRNATGAAVRSLPSAAALTELLCGSCAPAAALVVVKLFARSCRACLGASPRYAKSARAFHEAVGPQAVTFAEMDYSENKEFCQENLGVQALPFFAIFRRGNDDMPELVEGLNLAWNRLSLLDQRVEEILSEECLLPPDHAPVNAAHATLPFISSSPAGKSDIN
jgi:hypothetical protein